VSRIRLKASPNVLSRKMGEDLVLLNLNTNRFFELNRTGARFWELLVDGAELDSIENALAAEFEVTPSELSAEVASIVEAMRAEQLLTVENE
jgi:hypothetical protein